MSGTITRELLDNTFARMVTEGKRAGALDASATYLLQYGSASNGVSFNVLMQSVDGKRSGLSSTFPFLGFTKQSAYAVISVMEHAFRMVNLPV